MRLPGQRVLRMCIVTRSQPGPKRLWLGDIDPAIAGFDESAGGQLGQRIADRDTRDAKPFSQFILRDRHRARITADPVMLKKEPTKPVDQRQAQYLVYRNDGARLSPRHDFQKKLHNVWKLFEKQPKPGRRKMIDHGRPVGMGVLHPGKPPENGDLSEHVTRRQQASRNDLTRPPDRAEANHSRHNELDARAFVATLVDQLAMGVSLARTNGLQPRPCFGAEPREYPSVWRAICVQRLHLKKGSENVHNFTVTESRYRYRPSDTAKSASFSSVLGRNQEMGGVGL